MYLFSFAIALDNNAKYSLREWFYVCIIWNTDWTIHLYIRYYGTEEVF